MYSYAFFVLRTKNNFIFEIKVQKYKTVYNVFVRESLRVAQSRPYSNFYKEIQEKIITVQHLCIRVKGVFDCA